MWPMIVGMLWWCVMFVRLATVTLLILPDSTSHHVILLLLPLTLESNFYQHFKYQNISHWKKVWNCSQLKGSNIYFQFCINLADPEQMNTLQYTEHHGPVVSVSISVVRQIFELVVTIEQIILWHNITQWTVSPLTI